MAQPSNSVATVFEDAESQTGVDIAQAFTTGSDALFNSVTLSMDAIFGGDGFGVQLWSNSGGAPGVSLLTLTGSTNPNTTALYTYTAPAPYALTTGTTYWIVTGALHDGENRYFNWVVTTGNGETGLPGWTIADSAIFREVHGGSPDPWLSFDPYSGKMSLDVTAVPEPSALAFCGMAGAGLLGFRRRHAGRIA